MLWTFAPRETVPTCVLTLHVQTSHSSVLHVQMLQIRQVCLADRRLVLDM